MSRDSRSRHAGLRTAVMAILAATSVCAAGEIRLTSSYLWDFVVTGNWESDLTYKHPVTDALTLRGSLGYLDATQDAVSGILRLKARAAGLRVGGSWLTLWNCALIDAEAGIDILSDNRVAPGGRASVGAAVPLPANPLVQNLRVKPSAWYTQRQANAAAVLNRVASWGVEAEASASLIVQKIDVGCSYRLDHQWPADSVLDSLLLDTLASGRPALTIDDNRLYGFYVYLIGKIAPFLQAGYAFSWADCDEDRWTATRREPYVIFRGIGAPETGLYCQYAYYPYPTQRRSVAHMAVAVVPVSLGSVNLRGKCAFPFYSQRELFSSPDSMRLGHESMRNFYYTQKFTGPLNLEARISWAATMKLAITASYTYFCLPYREWSYFTKDSYSYHTVAAGASLSW